MLGFCMRLLIFIVPWSLLSLLVYFWLLRPLWKQGRMAYSGAVLGSVFWPVGLMMAREYLYSSSGQWRDAEYPWRSDGDDAPPEVPPKAAHNDPAFGGEKEDNAQDEPGPPPRRKLNYNNMVFGGNESDEDADEREFLNFISAQTGIRGSAPLKSDFTVNYAPSGISKTYRAGTMFPDAFITDWRAGFFRKK